VAAPWQQADGPRFARQDATSVGVTLRTTWTLKRDLTIQAFVQKLSWAWLK
jgi:hypothetical protein